MATHVQQKARRKKQVVALTNDKNQASMHVTRDEEEEEKLIDHDEKKRSESCQRRVFSLRNILTVFMSSLSMMAVVILAAISFGFFASNVVNNIHTVKEVYFSNLCSRILASLDTASTSVISASTAFEANFLKTGDFYSLRPYLYHTFRKCREASPLPINIYIGATTGELGGYWVMGGVLAEFQNFNTTYELKVTPVIDEVTGELDFTQTEFVPLSDETVYESPWYLLSQVIPSPQWIDVYPIPEYPQFLWITLIVPLHNESTGEWNGYISTDLSTDTIGKMVVEEARALKENEIIIVEKSTGCVVAMSDHTPLFVVHDDGSIDRFDGLNSRTPQILDTLKYVYEKYGKLFTKLGKEREHTQMRVGSHSAFITLQVISDKYGLEWVVIQSTNIRSFYGLFFNSIIAMCVISAFLLVLSVVLAIIIGTIVMKPLRHLLVNVKYLESMKLEEVESELKNFSLIHEVRGLQYGFLITTKRLKTLRSFIPDHVLSALEAEDHHTRDTRAPAPAPISIAPLKQHNNKEDSMSETSSVNQSVVNQSHASGSQRTKSTLAIGVRNGELTVAVIEIGNTLKYFVEGTPMDYSNLYRDVIGIVHSISRKFGAEFVSCTHNRITLVWNAFNPFQDHMSRASAFVNSFKNQLNKLQSQWSRQSIVHTSIHIGLSSGVGYFGNIGSTKSRFFTVFGSVLNGSVQCVTTAKEWNIEVVCCSTVAKGVESRFMIRPFTFSTKDPSFVMSEIGPMKAVKADEWMYEMEEKEKYNKWCQCIEAFGHMQQQNFSEAIKLLIQYLEKEPGDTVAQQMLSRCQPTTQ